MDHMDHMDTALQFPDDFEEFRARANSGGSLYGIFRRQHITSTLQSQASTIPEGGLPKPFKRQRSRSLITRNTTTLTDEKFVLLALYDYAEAQRHKTEIRRHSTAVSDGRDLRRVVLTNSLNKSLTLNKPHDLLGEGGGGGENEKPPQNHNFLSPDILVTPPPCESRKNSILVPPPSRKNSTCLVVPSPSRSRKNSLVINITPPSRKNSIFTPAEFTVASEAEQTAANLNLLYSNQYLMASLGSSTTVTSSSSGGNLLNPCSIPMRKYSLPKVMVSESDDDEHEDLMSEDLLLPPQGAVPVQRRRSFTITPSGVKNQGDIIIPSFHGMGGGGGVGGMGCGGGGAGCGGGMMGAGLMGTGHSIPSPASAPIITTQPHSQLHQQPPLFPTPATTMSINTNTTTTHPTITTQDSFDPIEIETGDIILQVPTIIPNNIHSSNNPQPPFSRASSVGGESDSENVGGGGQQTDTESAKLSESWDDIPCYRVLMLGGPGVGKTALTQQFMTSEYMAAQNTSFDDGIECPVPVLLDGEEYIMEFVDLPYTGNPNIWKDYEVDAYVVVFSLTDRRSFQKADDFVYDIRKAGHTDEAVILVANKSDLVRGRLVSENEARMLADGYGCKFIEVSAILNHKVDDLLVGILKQIRLSLDLPDLEPHEEPKGKECSDDSVCLNKAKHSMLGKLFKPRLTRSCENLLTL